MRRQAIWKNLAWLVAGVSLAAWTAFAQRPEGLQSPLESPEEHYRIEVRYDPEASRLDGSGAVRLKNTTGQPLHRLGLSWSHAQAGGLEVTLGGRAVALRGAASEPREFDLPAPLAPGQEIEIGIRFQRAVPKPGANQAVRLTNWHPRLWWGYETHASYDVAIDAPDDVVVAASARPDPATGRYRASHIRSFGLFFGRGYEAVEAATGETLVRAVFTPPARAGAEQLVKHAVDAVNFYRQRFGLYPQPCLTILPGEPPPARGGYPFATAMIMIHSLEAFAELPDSHWRWITAHEIGHQYWLEHVLAYEPEQGSGWLMIGLGIWADREYSRARGLDDLHPERLKSYADTVRNGLETTVELPPEQIRQLKFDYNSQVTHNKAYGILSALAAIVGRETFDRVHARCLRDYAGRRLGTAAFRRVVEEESGQDLGWFFVPWLRTSGYASYEIMAVEKAEEAGGHVIRVRIRHAGPIRIPVPVEARFADGGRMRLWTDRLRAEQTLEFRGKAPLAGVTIDPDREFPLVIPPPVKELQALIPKILEMPWTGAGDAALPLYEQAVKLEVKDPAIFFKLAMMIYDGRHYETALEAFARAAPPAKRDSPHRHFMAIVWQGIVLDILGRREQALARYREALALGDLRVQHDQYRLVIDRAWVEQRLQEPFQRP